MDQNSYEPQEVPLGQDRPYRPIPPETLHKIRINRALRKVKAAWVAAVVTGVVTLAATLVSVIGDQVNDVSGWNLIDVVLIFALAFGIYRKSRVCALITLLYYVLGKIAMWTVGPSPGGLPVTVLFVYCFVQGVIGTFQYHRLLNAPQFETRSS
jgi:serine/threonine-protein kinase